VLFVVESKGKRRSFEEALGDDAKVVATGGNCFELLKENGVVKENGRYVSRYHVRPSKTGIVSHILKEAEKHGTVVLAQDPDEEGESQAYFFYKHIKEHLPEVEVKRLWVFSLNPEEVIYRLESGIWVPEDERIRKELALRSRIRKVIDYLIGKKLKENGIKSGRSKIGIMSVVYKNSGLKYITRNFYINGYFFAGGVGRVYLPGPTKHFEVKSVRRVGARSGSVKGLSTKRLMQKSSYPASIAYRKLNSLYTKGFTTYPRTSNEEVSPGFRYHLEQLFKEGRVTRAVLDVVEPIRPTIIADKEIAELEEEEKDVYEQIVDYNRNIFRLTDENGRLRVHISEVETSIGKLRFAHLPGDAFLEEEDPEELRLQFGTDGIVFEPVFLDEGETFVPAEALTYNCCGKKVLLDEFFERRIVRPSTVARHIEELVKNNELSFIFTVDVYREEVYLLTEKGEITLSRASECIPQLVDPDFSKQVYAFIEEEVKKQLEAELDFQVTFDNEVEDVLGFGI